MPDGNSVEVSVAGFPSDPAEIPPPDALQSVAPKLNELVVGGKVLVMLDELESLEEIQKHERVMRYSEFSELVPFSVLVLGRKRVGGLG